MLEKGEKLIEVLGRQYNQHNDFNKNSSICTSNYNCSIISENNVQGQIKSAQTQEDKWVIFNHNPGKTVDFFYKHDKIEHNDQCIYRSEIY